MVGMMVGIWSGSEKQGRVRMGKSRCERSGKHLSHSLENPLLSWGRKARWVGQQEDLLGWIGEGVSVNRR